MKLTARMRETLQHAAKQDLRRVHDDKPGKPPWPAPPATLYALVRHELLEHARVRNRKGWHVDLWTITDTGRQALIPRELVIPDRPVYLNRWVSSGGDYTHNRHRASDDLEVIFYLPQWDRAATLRLAGAAHLQTRARRIRSGRKAA